MIIAPSDTRRYWEKVNAHLCRGHEYIANTRLIISLMHKAMLVMVLV